LTGYLGRKNSITGTPRGQEPRREGDMENIRFFRKNFVDFDKSLKNGGL